MPKHLQIYKANALRKNEFTLLDYQLLPDTKSAFS